MSTRLTCFKSTMRVWSRTASINVPKQRFLVRRSRPSPERTTSASASAVKVLWPRPQRSSSARMKASTASGPRRGQHDRVSHSRTDLLVDREGERLKQRRLADEQQVLEQQSQLAQALRLHEVRIVDDRHNELAAAIKPEGLLHKQAFAGEALSPPLDLSVCYPPTLSEWPECGLL